MKLTTQQFNKAKDLIISGSLSCVFISGSEEVSQSMSGYINDLKNSVISFFDSKLISYDILVFNQDSIENEKTILESYNTSSIFSDKKIIIANSIKPQVAEQIFLDIKDSKSDSILLLWCLGPIKKSVKKTQVENAQYFAIVDCYQDNSTKII